MTALIREMSHSVFKDVDGDAKFDSEHTADSNLIVFINKEGNVVVDQSALQDLIGEYCHFPTIARALSEFVFYFSSAFRSECQHR